MSTPVYDLFMIEVGVSSPEKLTQLMRFCHENGIIVPPIPANPFKQIAVGTERKLPTKVFKGFCGPENLNSAGKASVSDVCEFIKTYARNHKLTNADGSIELPPRMQEAFDTDKSRYYPHEFVYLAEKAFPS
jgi:hypothetical protein